MVKYFFHRETFERVDEDVELPVGQVDLLDDLSDRSDPVVVFLRVLFRLAVLHQDHPEEAVSLERLFDRLYVLIPPDDKRGEDPRKYGPRLHRDDG